MPGAVLVRGSNRSEYDELAEDSRLVELEEEGIVSLCHGRGDSPLEVAIGGGVAPEASACVSWANCWRYVLLRLTRSASLRLRNFEAAGKV